MYESPKTTSEVGGPPESVFDKVGIPPQNKGSSGEDLDQSECDRVSSGRSTRFGLKHGTRTPDEGLVISRLDKTHLHSKFVVDTEPADAVMISIEDARRLVDEGETAQTAYGTNVLVGVTTTIPDARLEWWYPQREIKIIRKFNPDFYIPCDRPVYRGDAAEKRAGVIKRYLRDLTEVDAGLREYPVTVIPLVKGITEAERRRCYRHFRELGLDRWAYYCAQYFLYGNRGEELVKDVWAIASEAKKAHQMLIGLQSERYISQMPPSVFAAAGQRWIQKSNLRGDIPMTRAKLNFEQWKEYLENRLSGGQTTLSRWVPESGGGVYGD